MTTVGNVQHKRGHNTMVTGAAMLVLGTALALAFSSTEGAAMGVFVLAAFAGFITLLVGIGRRRETPAG